MRNESKPKDNVDPPCLEEEISKDKGDGYSSKQGAGHAHRRGRLNHIKEDGKVSSQKTDQDQVAEGGAGSLNHRGVSVVKEDRHGKEAEG